MWNLLITLTITEEDENEYEKSGVSRSGNP